MTTTVKTETEVDRLLEELAELDAKDKEFGKRLYELGDMPASSGMGALEDKRQELRRDIEKNNARRLALRQQIDGVEAAERAERFEAVLRSPEYRQAALTALGTLETEIAPWAALYEFNRSERRLPPMPTVPALQNLPATRDWLQRLLNLKVIKASDVPPTVGRLVGVKP